MDDTDDGDKLLDATRKLCSAFSDLLKAAEPETKEVLSTINTICNTIRKKKSIFSLKGHIFKKNYVIYRC